MYKKESPLGLKYLGITSTNPIKYKGSGTYWIRHIRKHKLKYDDIKTTILFKSSDQELISVTGLFYSNLWNVVESLEWANLIPEYGYSIPMTKINKENASNIRSKYSKLERMHIWDLIQSGNTYKDIMKIYPIYSDKTHFNVSNGRIWNSITQIPKCETPNRETVKNYGKGYVYDKYSKIFIVRITISKGVKQILARFDNEESAKLYVFNYRASLIR